MKKLLPLALLTFSLSRFAAAQPAAMTGDEILAKSAKTYRELEEFHGGSKVNTTQQISIKGDLPQTLNQKAQASFDFKRGDHFIIKGLDTQGGAFSIENRGAKTTLTTNFGGNAKTETIKDLESGTASMTGVAMNAPTIIPALLTGGTWGFPYQRSAATLKGHETLEGHDCFLITQSSPALNSVSTFWIDSQSLLLRQLTESRGELKLTEEQLKQTPQLRDFQMLGSEAIHVFTIEPAKKP